MYAHVGQMAIRTRAKIARRSYDINSWIVGYAMRLVDINRSGMQASVGLQTTMITRTRPTPGSGDRDTCRR
ncbi:MAG TPA: hypothetical protein DCX80_12300 [Chloroflexi bacterium]|nr:hypothetical protein [Chloroflexota bacterium]